MSDYEETIAAWLGVDPDEEERKRAAEEAQRQAEAERLRAEEEKRKQAEIEAMRGESLTAPPVKEPSLPLQLKGYGTRVIGEKAPGSGTYRTSYGEDAPPEYVKDVEDTLSAGGSLSEGGQKIDTQGKPQDRNLSLTGKWNAFKDEVIADLGIDPSVARSEAETSVWYNNYMENLKAEQGAFGTRPSGFGNLAAESVPGYRKGKEKPGKKDITAEMKKAGDEAERNAQRRLDTHLKDARIFFEKRIAEEEREEKERRNPSFNSLLVRAEEGDEEAVKILERRTEVLGSLGKKAREAAEKRAQEKEDMKDLRDQEKEDRKLRAEEAKSELKVLEESHKGEMKDLDARINEADESEKGFLQAQKKALQAGYNLKRKEIIRGARGVNEEEAETTEKPKVIKPSIRPEPRQGTAKAPPAGFKQAPDGSYYGPDPNRPGKYLRWKG